MNFKNTVAAISARHFAGCRYRAFSFGFNSHSAGRFGNKSAALGRARLKHFFHPWQTLGDIIAAGHATGMKSAHG